MPPYPHSKHAAIRTLFMNEDDHFLIPTNSGKISCLIRHLIASISANFAGWFSTVCGIKLHVGCMLCVICMGYL